MFFEDDLTRQPWEEAPQTVVATSPFAVPLTLRAVEHESTPEGMLCVGAFIDERMVARFVAPDHDALARLQRLVEGGVPLLFAAREKDGGINGRLCALVSYARARAEVEEASGSDEPWKVSVPSTDSWKDDAGEAEVPEDALMPLPLGTIVRVPGDRKHPDDLGLEAASVLQKILAGETHEVVDRLLGSL